MALIDGHIVKVEESLQSMLSALEDYLGGRVESAGSFASMTRRAESEADEIRREIADLLHRGAFLPVFREDVIELVAVIDRIAECAQDCCKLIMTQHPDVPAGLKEAFLEIAKDSVSSFSPLQEGTAKLSEDFSVARERITEVHSIESAVDETEWQLCSNIFSTDLSLAQKMHLKQLVDVIVAVSDISEDAAEILDTLIVKKQI